MSSTDTEQSDRTSNAEDLGCSQTSTSARAVSIVIISWNTRELLLDVLRTFLPFDGIEGEVIVVDNASADGSADAVADAHPGVRVIRNESNLGFAGGVNVGLRAARNPYVLLLNTDTLVVEDAIPRLIDYAVEHPEAGIIGPRVLNQDGSLQDSKFRFPSVPNLLLSSTYLYKLFPRSRILNRERLVGIGRNECTPVDAVSGCCFLIRQDVIQQVGVFDEGYFMYAEETDLCFRAWAHGFQVHYAPVGEIVHFGGGSSKLASRKMFIEYRRSILRFFSKHRGQASTQAARWLLLLFLLLRVPYWAIRAAGLSGDRQADAERLSTYIAGAGFLLQPLDRILLASPSRSA